VVGPYLVRIVLLVAVEGAGTYEMLIQFRRVRVPAIDHLPHLLLSSATNTRFRVPQTERERGHTDLDRVGFADESLSGMTAQLLQVGEVPASFVPELDQRVRDLEKAGKRSFSRQCLEPGRLD
jgi:hypothetical protein